jgi:histidine ammonia-lyase
VPPVTVVLADPTDLDLPAFRRVAWEGEGIALADAAVARMAATRNAFEEFVEAAGDRHLYGITTAHHRGARTLLSPQERVAYARRIPPTPASLGPALPQRVVRGIVAARVAGFIGGTAAVRPELARATAALLDGPMPSVAARGHGEPGEIGTLRTVFGGLEHALELGAKEGMALVNGAPASAAVLADATLANRGRLEISDEILALAFYASGALDAHLDTALGDAWRDPHEAAALARLRELTEGGIAAFDGHRRRSRSATLRGCSDGSGVCSDGPRSARRSRCRRRATTRCLRSRTGTDRHGSCPTPATTTRGRRRC